jgi:hypothetical protein
MQPTIDLRTPSFAYNHGGYYAPSNPRDCITPGGPCSYCQARIDEEAAASALLTLCCQDRPAFLEPCPSCNTKGTYITHASKGLRTCNGCEDKFCTKCYHGSRYCCAYVYGADLSSPSGPLERLLTLGVSSPKAEEKTENK